MELAEERRRKVEAGRAKLAHFRQRKTKGDSPHSQKKTSKRKDSSIHSHDLPTQEHPLELRSDCLLADSKSMQKNIPCDHSMLVELEQDSRISNLASFEKEFMDAAVDAHSRKPTSSELTDSIFGAGIHSDSLKFDNVDLADMMYLSNKEQNFENVEITDGEIDASLQDQTTEPMDLIAAQRDGILQEQTIETTELTSAEIDATIQSTFSESTPLVDVPFEGREDELELAMVGSHHDLQSHWSEITKLEERFLERSEVQNHVDHDKEEEEEEEQEEQEEEEEEEEEEDNEQQQDEKEESMDLLEHFLKQVGSQNGEGVPEQLIKQTVSWNLGQVQEQHFQLTSLETVMLAESWEQLSLQTDSMDMEDHHRELSHETGCQELEDILEQTSAQVIQQTTKDKDNLLAKMEETLKGTEDSVHQLHQGMVEQEQTIQSLEDKLVLSNQNISVLKQTLSLQEQEVMDLKIEIASVRQRENDSFQPAHTDVTWGSPQELFDKRGGYREAKSSMHQTLCEELNVKLKDELAKLHFCRVCSDQNLQGINSLITDLNSNLRQSEAVCESLRQALLDQVEEFNRERFVTEQKYSDLLDDLKIQLNYAEEQAREALMCKHEKERLNEEVKELQIKLLLETENCKVLGCQLDEAAKSYAVKLQTLELEKAETCQELVRAHTADLERIRCDLVYRYEGEMQLLRKELGCEHDLRVNTFKQELDNLKRSLHQVKSRNSLEGVESTSVPKVYESEILEPSTREDSVMAKYLAPTTLQEQSVETEEETLTLELSSHDEFDLHGVITLEPSLNSTLDYDLFCSPLAITDVLEGGAAHCKELDVDSFAVYLSSNRLPSVELNNSSENLDVNTCLIERCILLTKQLEEKEQQLSHSKEAMQEAQKKLSLLTETFSAAHEELALYKQEFKPWNVNKNQVCAMEKQHEQGDHQLPFTGVDLQLKDPDGCALHEKIKELQHEKEILLEQLGKLEDLLKEVQVHKTKEQSMTHEMHCIFGHQLATLQSHQQQFQLEAGKDKTVPSSELLRKEDYSLRSVLVAKEKAVLELAPEMSMQQGPGKAKNAFNSRIEDQTEMEQSHVTLQSKVEHLKGALETPKLQTDEHLNCKELEHGEQEKARKKMGEAEHESMNGLHPHFERGFKEDILRGSVPLQETSTELQIYQNAENRRPADLQSQVLNDVQLQHHVEAREKEQHQEITKAVTGHLHEINLMRATLTGEQQHLFDALQERVKESRQAEVQHALFQAQTLHHLEVEAVRLSLANMHTAHMELTHSNLQKERETALVELREMLNTKRAQEVAILQSRHQFDMERIQEHHSKEIEELTMKHQQEIDEAKQKLELELVGCHNQNIQALRKDWEEEANILLNKLREELSTHQKETDGPHVKLPEQETRMHSLSLEKDQTDMMCERQQNNLSHVNDLQPQPQSDYEKHLEEPKQKSRATEDEHGQQIGNLQADYEELQKDYQELKTQSEEEIKELWSQLDSTRTSRQELSDLREQLLARTSHVAEIERVKRDCELQRQKLKEAHETELEQLRIYFEQKLRATEENYREDLTLLHQRLREVKDDMAEEKAANVSSSVFSDELSESSNHDLLEQLTQQLDQHKEELLYVRLQAEERHSHELESVRSSLTLQYKENLLNLKLELSDQFIAEIESLKKKHCLELEQLRAQLSDQHIRDITKLRLQSAQDAARLVEAEVAAQICMLEGENKTRISFVKSNKQSKTEMLNLPECLILDCDKTLHDLCKQHHVSLQEELVKIKPLLLEQHRAPMEKSRVDAAPEQQKCADEVKWKDLTDNLIAKGEEADTKQRSNDDPGQEQKNLGLSHMDAISEKLTQTDFNVCKPDIKVVQEQQAVRIVELEKLVKEQQNSISQLEDILARERATQNDFCIHYKQELTAAKTSMEKELEEVTQVLREKSASKLREAELRYVEKQKEMLGNLSSQHNAALQELRHKHQQEQHRGQINSLPEEVLAKQQSETQTLQAVLKNLPQTQLEVHLAELNAALQTQVGELEAQHLSKLDSLECSYLSEIQSIRDEHKRSLQDLEVYLSQRLREKEEETGSHLARQMEHLQAAHDEEMQLVKEALRKELTALHMDRVKALGAELEAAHTDLNEALNQRRLMEVEHCNSLDIVRAEVLKIEAQHKSAMQELQELHTREVHQQKACYDQQLQQLKCQPDQQIWITEKETLLVTLTTQLQEKSDQLLQLQEEMELLKCQSEILLEQQISQLKTGFEAERRSLLHEKEHLQNEMEKGQAIHQQEKEHLEQQIQEKSESIIQLEAKVCSLNKKMEESYLQLETLVHRRERENLECETLVAMLRSDANTAHQNEKSWQDCYQRVMKLFTEMVRSTIATEDLISTKVGLCLDDSLAAAAESDIQNVAGLIGILGRPKDITEHNSDQGLGSPDGGTVTDHSLLSTLTDDGCDLSEHICESLLGSPELLAESEVRILKISQRLRTAVERLLELVSDSTKQLEQTHEIQAHFEEEFNRRNQETVHVVKQHQELLQRLNEESDGKQKLVLELHKARGVIEGYVAEKAALEEALSEKEYSRRSVIVELENLREEFKVLSHSQLLLAEERELLQRLKSDGGDLVRELDRLSQEKLELKCQSEKDRSNLMSQMKVLEVELEEQMSRNQELAIKTLQVCDLQQQIQVLEKQLKNQRHFMDEQAVEREHERDDFQQEIQRLEGQLKQTVKSHSVGEGRGYGVDPLQVHVKTKADGYNLLLLGKEQLEQEIVEQNKDIEKMTARIQELEQAILSNSETEKRCNQLEQEVLQMKSVEMELLQDKESLQKQQYNNALQISALQSKLDEARHRYPPDSDTGHTLKEQLQAEHEALLIKEKEAESLAEQVEHFREGLLNKTEEILQLHLQLEVQKKQSESSMQHLQEDNTLLKEDLSSFRRQMCLDSEGNTQPLLQFPHILLEEKNQEIDHLNEQLLRLQHELKRSPGMQFDRESSQMEELKSCIEHLRSDQERLRRDKEEEVEQLHEVIEKLQQELALLGPIRHEVSDSQDNLDELGLGSFENLQDELRKGSRGDCHQRGQESALKALQEELDLVCTSQEALRQLLDDKESQFGNERNILEQNIHNLQESACQQLQELTSLRLQHVTLQEEYDLLREHLSLRNTEMALMSSRMQEHEDTLREKEATLIERELQIKTMEEQRLSEQTDFECLASKMAELQAELTKRELLLQNEVEHFQALQAEGAKQALVLQDMHQREDNHCKEYRQLQTDAARLQAQIDEDATELQDLRSLRDKLGALLPGHKQKEAGIIQEIKVLQQKLTKHESQVQSLTQKLIEWQTGTSDPKFQQVSRDIAVQDQHSSAEVETSSINDSIFQTCAQCEDFKAEVVIFKQELQDHDERSSHLLQQLQEKEAAINDFQTRSQNLKIQIKHLQETLLQQESEITNKDEELNHLRLESQTLQELKESLKNGFSSVSHIVETSVDGCKDFAATLIDLSPWGSPEVVRKQDSSLEHVNSLHRATPFSEISVLYSTDLEMATAKSTLHGDTSDLLGCQSMFTNVNQYSKEELDFRKPSFSGSSYSSTESPTLEKSHLSGDDAAFDFMLSSSQEDPRSSSSIPEPLITDHGSHTSLGSEDMLDKKRERVEQQMADHLTYLEHRIKSEKAIGSKPDLTRKLNLSPQLQSMLTIVHEESCKVLALSKHAQPCKAALYPRECTLSESWQQDRQTLLDTVHSLKDLISKAAQRVEDFSDPHSDWRGELLQAVQVLFQKERDFMCTELRPHLCSHVSGDDGSLVGKLEHIVKEQEQQQQLVLEHLLSSDRSSLLSEIQELRAQLRMTHLQNQEKLEQLQESITNAEDHGSKQEHQLKRQIELLEYKLQQEMSITGDLKTSLGREQDQASELRKQLSEARESTSQIKFELAESKQEVKQLLLSQQDLQNIISRLSATLKDKEHFLSAAQESLHTECKKWEQQQAMWEQQQLQTRLSEDQRNRTIQELENDLEELQSQKKQLSVALDHEQASVSNLQKELQIEQSRCDALLCQERGKVLEMQHSLEREKTRSAELSSTLQHERALLEQLNKKQTGEEFHRLQREAIMETSLVLDLQAELESERHRAIDLAAMLERTQQQAIQSKRQLEAEVHLCQEETQKEREMSTKLRASLESLKTQKQEVLTLLETQRERLATLESERGQLEARITSMKELELCKQEERNQEKRRHQQAEADKEKQWQRDQEILHELQRQHQRDELRMKELQQTLTELEEEERNLLLRKRQRANPSLPQREPTNPSLALPFDLGTKCLQQLQKMEKVRQHLLSAAIHLKEYGRNVSDRTFTQYSDEEALASLLKMLTDLKMELQRLSSFAQNPVEGSVSLTDVLMVENEELTKSVITLTEEKLGLTRDLSTLEKDLKHQLRRGTGNEQVWSLDASDPVPDIERINWQREKIILQNALKQSEAELARVTAGIENRPLTEPSNSKVQRLYRKYLRAESFRKALVYQKKYLLLLLGGFQDCEQATLSMIARMGVYPSPVDLQVVSTHSYAFTKFRSTVRAVIAISRLKFLVKKWQRVHKKASPVETLAQVSTPHQVLGTRSEVLRHSAILNSPPTREQTSCHRSNSATNLCLSPKSPYFLHNRSQTITTSSPNRSRTSSDEPERSLLDYIRHLEVIQHRLGGLHQGGSQTHF